jgi:hypothetical protein
MRLSRKSFIKKLTVSFLGLHSNGISRALFDQKDNHNMEYGWTTCLTYETGDRQLSFDYFNNLLQEMNANGMSRLIVMMASHGYFDPKSHGLAWPVRNKKLGFQVDEKAINAQEESEFFSRVILRAKELGIKILIEIKYLGLIGLEQGYPGVEFLRTKAGDIIHNIRPEASDYEREAIKNLHLCCDSPQAHSYMRDKVTDVLTRYNTLDGIVLEHPSYSGNTCYCKWSRQRIKKDTGRNIEELSRDELLQWKAKRIKEALLDLKELALSINPKFEFGFYSGFSPTDGNIAAFQQNRGHNTKTLSEIGLDFIMPYCEGRHRQHETKEIERVINYLTPLDFYLHTTIRRESPKNYNLPPKGPEYIKDIIQWGKLYQRKNSRFKGMIFFNEVKIPQENREAVYRSIKEK